MKDEYWGTLSIFDHRTPLYRQALVMFDRIVVPIPRKPIADITQDEIENLTSQVDQLAREDAAVRFQWDAGEFEDWREKALPGTGEGIAAVISRDKPWETRLQMQYVMRYEASEFKPRDVDRVTAVPVYGSRARYESLPRELLTGPALLNLEILKHVPTPDPSVPLEEILKLRRRKRFRHALDRLHNWEDHVLPSLLAEATPAREAALRAAGSDFAKWTSQYGDAIRDARIGKAQTAVVSVLAVGAAVATGTGPLIATMAGIAPPVFSIRGLIRPSWMVIEDRVCAPAGVIYEAQRLFRRKNA